MKVKKKKLAMLAASLGLAATLAFPNTSYARDTNYTNGASFGWSPYTWSASGFKWNNEITGSFTNVKFSSSAASSHNSMYYLTFEINHTRDHNGHTGWYWTNLPDPGYDRDDDNGNGWSEEAEAYIEADGWKQSISAYTGYGFQSSWWLSSSGNFDFIVQRSLYNPIAGEMEAWHYDKITNRGWSGLYSANSVKEKSPVASAPSAKEDVLYSNNGLKIAKVKEADSKTADVYVQPNVASKADFSKYKNQQKELLKQIDKENIEVVLTFNKSLSVKEVEKLIKKYDIAVDSYEIKSTDKKGEWTTIGGTPDKKELFSKAQYDNVTKGRGVKFSGFTSLVGTVNKDQLANLEKEKSVFFADVSKEYAKSLVKNQDVDVLVPDFAWEVNDLK